MKPPSHAVPTRRAPWKGELAPLNLIGYLTWVTVTAVAIDWEALAGGAKREWAGLGCLAAMIVLLAIFARREGGASMATRLRTSLAVGEGVAIVAAMSLTRTALPAILLAIVAAQLSNTPGRRAIAWMLLLNVATALSWSQWMTPTGAALTLLPVMGIETFVAAMVHYAGSLERARDELARVNTELLATRVLLDESARSEERLRLSRELHDVAGHKLTALKLNLVRLARDARLGSREEVTTAAGLADELLHDIRTVVGELRKHDGIDLRAAIEELTAHIPGVRFVIDMPEDARASSVQAAEALLRCAQEGITNAVRHGYPTTITVACRRRGDSVELRVSDDGSPAPRICFGNGLNGMRERLERAGGRLHVGSAAGRGVELVASLPLSASR